MGFFCYESFQNPSFLLYKWLILHCPEAVISIPSGKSETASFTKQFFNIPTSATKYSQASGLFLLPRHRIFVAGHHLLELPLAGHRTHLVAHLGSQLQPWGEERQPAGNALAPLVPQSGSKGAEEPIKNRKKHGKNLAMLLGKKDEPLD